jgi:hypothetical protein
MIVRLSLPMVTITSFVVRPILQVTQRRRRLLQPAPEARVSSTVVSPLQTGQ